MRVKDKTVPVISIDGIVAARDFKPYVRIFKDNEQFGQLSIAEARNVAMDILQQCSRVEADAMILKFFKMKELPNGAASTLMIDFREFRKDLDTESVERSFIDPDSLETQ